MPETPACKPHSYAIRPDDQLTANVIVWTCAKCGDQRFEVNTGPRIESDAAWKNRMAEQDLRNYREEQRRDA